MSIFRKKTPTLFSCTINLIDYTLKKKTPSLLLAASMLKTEGKKTGGTLPIIVTLKYITSEEFMQNENAFSMPGPL